MRKKFGPWMLSELRGIHSALDDALGDSDIEHMDDEELRDAYPVQWAAARIAELIDSIRRQQRSGQ